MLMKFLSDIRLLLLAIWLGGAVFFIGMAQTAFAVIADRQLAGAMIGRNLALLDFSGIGISVLLLVSSVIGTAGVSKIWLWIERLLLLLIAAACAFSQFVIGYWMSSLRAEMTRPIEELAADDPLRLRFETIHEYSAWLLIGSMVAALLVFFIIANRKSRLGTRPANDIYDFSKEFKV